MTSGLIGRKLGMTRVFSEDGTAVPVTIIEAGPCRVVQVREGGVQLGFGGGPATHGNTRHRKPGSISPGTDPSRVIKGKKMPGHMGAARHTELGLTVVKVDAERNLLFVRGAIPGARNGIVTVAKQGGPSRHD